MKFVVATRDYAGLGFAIRLREEANDVLLAPNPPAEIDDPGILAAYHRVGDGLVEKAALATLIEGRAAMRDWYWIWDSNHSVEENELLRGESFRVFGGGEYADRMEHDRETSLQFASAYGLSSPPSRAFTSTREATDYCRANPATAYVYKPDEGANFETFLPESEDPEEANYEMRNHLASLPDDGRSFLLQERKEGVETNVEVWFQNGEPVFAFMGLECKKKYVADMGPLAGCAFDFVFTIPLDARAVTESVGKLFPAYRAMQYTGFGDANFVAARDGIWFFEKCERFGYNAHPNLLFNLSRQPLGETLAALTEGSFRPDFAGGFGASVTLSTRENPAGGKVIQFPPRLRKDLFFWDVYRRGELYLTAGFEASGDVLLVLAYGYTIPTAWENVMKKAAQVKFPYRHYRIDGGGTNYPSSPIRRYEALDAMGYL